MSASSVARRAPDIVMSPPRARAAVPNALSFSRAAMRELVRGRYRVEKVRFELDREGRGEVLYRLHGGGWTFHFFLVSQKLPEAQKTDRNFAQSWDAMGVLCQGEWTAAREAHLRREVPKQRAGFADYDTLIYARGNRSARLFDHVVDSLAAGHQPDLALLAPIGYILRTTAFIGNGQLGTRPYAGYEPGHPLRRPYHAQFCSAFMLREYVFDLVDHLARERNPDAPRLAYAYRRFLGLGNAAATGLVPFVVNHPHLMHQWCLAYETVLAQAKARPAAPGDAVVARFALLLDKAIMHHAQSAREPDGVFTPAQALAAELERVRDRFDAWCESGLIDGQPAPLPWPALCDWAARNVDAEAVEIVSALVIELHPDLVEAAVDDFHADERFVLDPAMTARELRELVHRHYGWAQAPQFRDTPPQHFWYRSTKAPRDVRRGLRGREPLLEFETAMDTVLQTQRLARCLDDLPQDVRVADIVCARPDLRHIAARVQSLAGLDYAELREHWLAPDFSPFGPVRFALAFYGMEKFEAALPKSVRGTFMQGAPIAEDVALGLDGDWPFPLMPSAGAAAGPMDLEPLPRPRGHTTASGASLPPPSVLRVAPPELSRMVQTALQGHGVALGVAEDAAGLVTFAQACGQRAVATLLRQCAQSHVAGSRTGIVRRGESHVVFACREQSALPAAPDACDLASVAAQTSRAGIGVSLAIDAIDASLVAELPLRAAQRGLVGVLMWAAWEHDQPRYGVAVAGPEPDGAWFASAPLANHANGHAALVAVHHDNDAMASAVAGWAARIGRAAGGLAAMVAEAVRLPRRSLPRLQQGFAFACLRPGSVAASQQVFQTLSALRAHGVVLSAGELRSRRTTWLQQGIALPRVEFDALNAAAAALLVPEVDEPRVLDAGADPLKVF